MLTINLEKELLKQNKQIISAEELLYVKEYDRLGDDIADSEILKRVGLVRSITFGKNIKSKSNEQIKETSQFPQERVFHISQIEKLCNKYYLRFLPSCRYDGTIDKELPLKISAFEITHNVKCKSEIYGLDTTIGNTFIAAPAPSFELQKKPKDPLFFYRINENYYYLIHKWGNDLSIVRRFYNFLSSPLIIPGLLFCLYIFVFFSFNNLASPDNTIGMSIALFVLGLFITVCIFSIIGLLISFINRSDDGLWTIRIMKKNEWNSHYL